VTWTAPTGSEGESRPSNGVESVDVGQYYFYRSAAGAPRLSGSNPVPRALRQEGRVLRNILIIVYLVVGVVIASSHHYFTHLNSLTSVLSALLAVVLWPLILFGVNLHIK
jgi:hypothetical protein